MNNSHWSQDFSKDYEGDILIHYQDLNISELLSDALHKFDPLKNNVVPLKILITEYGDSHPVDSGDKVHLLMF